MLYMKTHPRLISSFLFSGLSSPHASKSGGGMCTSNLGLHCPHASAQGKSPSGPGGYGMVDGCVFDKDEADARAFCSKSVNRQL